MFDFLWDTGDRLIQTTAGFDRQQWLVVFLVIVVVGWYCLRGFGSREGY